MEPAVTVIIVNYNAGVLLKQVVAHLLAQTVTSFEALLVDNGSSDGSLDALPDDPRLRLIRPGRNLGFAAANNLALSEARAPLIATLNPDALAAPDWLRALLDAATSYPQASCFGSVQISLERDGIVDGLGDQYAPFGIAWRGGQGRLLPAEIRDGEVFGPCAAAALYRRDALERVGGFEESFFCYYEDVDLAARLRLDGGIAVTVAAARVRHYGGGTTADGSERQSAFVRYHLIRNQLRTWLRIMPGPLLLLGLPAALAIHGVFLVRRLLRGQAAEELRAYRDVWAGFSEIWAQRRRIQARRRVGLLAFARALTWSPLAWRRQSARLRPLSGP